MNITLGQYYPVNSVVHRLDPRVKIILTLLYIVAIFTANNFCGYLACGIYLFIAVKFSKVPFKLLLNGLKAIYVIIIFTMILNLFFTNTGEILLKFYFIKITSDGLYLALKMAVRLVLLITGSSVLTLATSPIQLTDGIECLLKPFKKVKVPAHEIAMMMTIALRFIPTLMEELEKIKKAQSARGADFESGGLIKRAKSLIPVLVPLFISSFRRADDLALAMEARCYRGDYNRTKMKVLKYSKYDLYAVISMIVLFIVIILIRVVL